jgi:hypothetical protein
MSKLWMNVKKQIKTILHELRMHIVKIRPLTILQILKSFILTLQHS